MTATHHEPDPADVELVAGVFITEAKKNPVDTSHYWWGTSRLLVGPNEHDIARAVLTALAAAGRLVPVDADQGHVIEFRADGWTIKHPLSCRPNLFDCPVNRIAEVDLCALDGPPAPPGRYECSLNDLGDRIQIGDRIEAAG